MVNKKFDVRTDQQTKIIIIITRLAFAQKRILEKEERIGHVINFAKFHRRVVPFGFF